MKALVYHGPKHVSVDTVPDPEIKEARDAIIRVTATAICGSDLHIYNGLIPDKQKFVVGHEFMGIVEETGGAVSNLKKGDRVVVPFPIGCGHCYFCQQAHLPTQCENSNPEFYGPEGDMTKGKGGALFGYTSLYGGYDGGQAEYVRVPYADFGPRKVPDNLKDEQVLFLTYIDELIEYVKQDKVTLNDIITHRLPLSEAAHGYKVFNEKKENCVKVVLQP